VRIVHVVSRSQRRGAERVALDLAEELDELGHENRVVALVLGLDGSEDPALPALVQSSSIRAGMRTLGAWRLGRMLERERPDVVLAHGGGAAQVTIAGMPRHRPTVVWQQILGFPQKIRKPPRRALWWAVARRVDGAVALTDEEAEELRWLGFRGPMWVIPNFRRPQRFFEIDRDVEAVRLREQIGVDRATPLIGLVGYLVDQKRPERAVEVLAGVRDRGVPAHLVVAGSGPLQPMLERAIRARGLEAHVTLLGHRNDVERVFGGVDVALLTSDVEGIPGVAIEAAMTGCPFVTFPLGGVNEVVIDGVTGIVLERPDTNLMAERVVGLFQNDTLRQTIGDEARHRSPRFAAPERASVYAELLAKCHNDHNANNGRRRPWAKGSPATGAVDEYLRGESTGSRATRTKRVSVIIPTLDRRDLVLRAVRSVQEQTWPPHQIIVVDDASADGTADLIEALGDPTIRVVRRSSSGGPSIARNDGIEQATGDVLCFLDSDDEWLPNMLSTMLPILERDGPGLACASFEVRDGTHIHYATPEVARRGRPLERLLALKGGPLTPSVFALDRAVTDSGIRFDPDLPALEDLDFAIQVARAGFFVGGTRRVLVRKYNTPDEPRVFRPDNEIPGRSRLLVKYDEMLATRPAARVRQNRRLAFALYRCGKRADAEALLSRSAHDDGRPWSSGLLLKSMRVSPKLYFALTRMLHLENGVVGTLQSRARDAVALRSGRSQPRP
jgi:glycosyltransferase involved in cell wall biosynthesis